MIDAADRANEPNKAPGALSARLGKLIAGGGIAMSAIAHLTLGGVLLLASPRSLATVPEDSITVEILTPQEFAAESSPLVSAPLSTNTHAEEPIAQQVSGPQPTAEPQQSRPPIETQAPVPRTDLRAPDERSAQTAPGPDQALPDPEQVAKLLNLSMQVANPDREAPPSENSANLSSSEIAGLKQRLRTCWVAPTGASDAKPNVVMRISLGPNGRLRAEPEVISISNASSLDGPALVNSAKRTLTRCQPYSDLPQEKYQQWQLLDLHFSRDGIADVALPHNNNKERPRG